MAQIKTDGEALMTAAEARSFIKNLGGQQYRFSVRLGFMLPAVDEAGEPTGRGYDGSGLLSVSRAQALEAIEWTLGNYGSRGFTGPSVLEQKGARIRIHWKAPDPRYGASNRLAFVYIG